MLGLPARESRELRAADAVGEAEEVLDQGGMRCCPPGRSASNTTVESPSEAA